MMVNIQLQFVQANKHKIDKKSECECEMTRNRRKMRDESEIVSKLNK